MSSFLERAFDKAQVVLKGQKSTVSIKLTDNSPVISATTAHIDAEMSTFGDTNSMIDRGVRASGTVFHGDETVQVNLNLQSPQKPK